MAKLFSINFNFQNKTYTAMISMRQQANDLCCFVRYIDKDLQYILPGDGFVFSLGEGLKSPHHLPSKLAETLIFSTTEAIIDQLPGEQNY